MRRLLIAIGGLLRASLMSTMQYRSDFLFELLTGALRTIGAVAPLWVVYGHVDDIGGWSQAEATLVMGFFLLLGAFQSAVLEPNLGEVVDNVRKGTLDLLLLKPIDAQWIVSLRKIDPAYVWDLFAGLFVVGWAVVHLPAPAPADVAVALTLFTSGLVAVYGLWIAATALSFHFVRVDNLRYLLISAADAGRWPLTVFSSLFRLLLVAVVPVGVVTTFPAQALRGEWGAALVAQALAVAAVFAVGSRIAWVRSLRRYTSASS